MKVGKIFWAWIVCILLVAGIAAADELAPILGILAATESEGTLNTVVYTTVEGNLQPGDFEAMADGQPAAVSEVSSLYRSEKIGSTYLFVIDMPGNKNDLEKLKSLAKELMGEAGTNDNFGVMGVDSTASSTSLTGSKEAAVSAVDQIVFSKSPNATLNTAVVQALECLQTNDQAKTRKCLVLLSACDTKNKTVGATDAEVEKAIQEKACSIYTVALLAEKDNSKERINNASYLGSLSRMGKGGLPLSVKGNEVGEAVADFSQNEKRFFVLALTIDQFQGKRPAKLNLSIKDNGRVLSDSMDIAQGAWAQASPTPVPTATTEPKVVSAAIPFEVWLFGGAGLVLVALIVILISLTMKNKKKRQQKNEITNPVPADVLNGAGQIKTEVDNQQRVRITLTGIGETTNKNFKMDVRDGILIGRDNEEARVRLDYDRKLSRRHAVITYAGGFMRIEDLNSQNGTRINQEVDKIVSPRVLNQSDTFRVGRSEFRVNWTVE